LEIPFRTKVKHLLHLVLDLSPPFPSVPPQVFLREGRTLKHRLLKESGSGKVFYPNLDPIAWGAHTDLVPILKEIINAFATDSPIADSSKVDRAEKKGDLAMDSVQDMLKASLPQVPSYFEMLEDMTIAQLEELAENDADIDTLIQSMEVNNSYVSAREDLATDVLKLARTLVV
jgi:hypothetical protein